MGVFVTITIKIQSLVRVAYVQQNFKTTRGELSQKRKVLRAE